MIFTLANSYWSYWCFDLIFVYEISRNNCSKKLSENSNKGYKKTLYSKQRKTYIFREIHYFFKCLCVSESVAVCYLLQKAIISKQNFIFGTSI